jgi:hypothetical protein
MRIPRNPANAEKNAPMMNAIAIDQCEFSFAKPITPSNKGGDNYEVGKHFVFRFQEGHCPFGNVGADFLHPSIASTLLANPIAFNNGVEHGQHTENWH